MSSWWSPARWPTMLIPARIGEGSAVGEKRTRRSTGPGGRRIEIASPTPNTTYNRTLQDRSVASHSPGVLFLFHDERGKHDQRNRPSDRRRSGDCCNKGCE